MPEPDNPEPDNPEPDNPEHRTPEPSGPGPTAPATDALVERWFLDSFPGSPVARSTEAWNVVHDAKEELKRRLASSRDPGQGA